MLDLRTILARHPFFAGVGPKVLDATSGRAVVRTYKKHALIHVEGEPTSGLCIVAAGQIRVFKTSDDGRDQDLFHASPGESINEVSALDHGPAIANAQATEPTVVIVIGRDALNELRREFPELSGAMVEVLAGRVRELASLAGDLSLRSVVARVAQVLLRLAQGNTAQLPTRSDLAARVGTVREVATRALQQLEASGAIRLEPGAAVILDQARLQEVAGQPWPGSLAPLKSFAEAFVIRKEHRHG